MKSLRRLLMIVVLALASSFAISWGLRFVNFGSRPLPKTTTSGAAAIGGPFRLVATNGEVVTDRTYRGKWVLIFFGYTFCPDVCPTALSNMTVAMEKLGSEAAELQPLFITVDPERDTRDVLTEYLKSFDPRIVGLTGTQAQIGGVVREYRVYVAQQRSKASDKEYLISHSGYIYLMDPDGKFVNVIRGGEDGESIAASLRREMSGSRQ